MMNNYLKNEKLVEQLNSKQDTMCGIGIRKLKLFLNGLIKKNDSYASLYRELLEMETCNIKAKKYRNTSSVSYKDLYYNEKHDLINHFLRNLIESNPTGLVYGLDKSDVSDTSWIIYFENDEMGQVSFHTEINGELINHIPHYEKPWDGHVNSTLLKLEKAINKRYGSLLREKYKTEYEEYINKNKKEKEKQKTIKKIIKKIEEGFQSVFSMPDEEKEVFNDAFNRVTDINKRDKFILSMVAFLMDRYAYDGVEGSFKRSLGETDNDKKKVQIIWDGIVRCRSWLANKEELHFFGIKIKDKMYKRPQRLYNIAVGNEKELIFKEIKEKVEEGIEAVLSMAERNKPYFKEAFFSIKACNTKHNFKASAMVYLMDTYEYGCDRGHFISIINGMEDEKEKLKFLSDSYTKCQQWVEQYKEMRFLGRLFRHKDKNIEAYMKYLKYFTSVFHHSN